MFVFVKNPENVFATLRKANILDRNVFNPDTVCVFARIISPPPLGVAKVPSHRRKVVVLFGGVGTAPPTVEVITGRSHQVAILGTPVVVVFFKIPVASPLNSVPFIHFTVRAVEPVASPV